MTSNATSFGLIKQQGTSPLPSGLSGALHFILPAYFIIASCFTTNTHGTISFLRTLALVLAPTLRNRLVHQSLGQLYAWYASLSARGLKAAIIPAPDKSVSKLRLNLGVIIDVSAPLE